MNPNSESRSGYAGILWRRGQPRAVPHAGVAAKQRQRGQQRQQMDRNSLHFLSFRRFPQ